MGFCGRVAVGLLALSLTLRAGEPTLTDVGLWPNPPFVNLPLSGHARYGDPDGDSFEQGEYRFLLNDVPGAVAAMPADLVLNADGSAMSDGLHAPAESTSIVYTDGVFGESFSFAGNPRLRFDDGPLSDPSDGGVDFWFRLHHNISDSIYVGWRVFFWLETTTGDDIYIETSVGTIYGTSYSGGQYAGAWTGQLSLDAGEWRHFAFGWDEADSSAIVWLDGEIAGESADWPGVMGNSAEIYIGNAPGGSRSALADIDAFRLWNRIPTDAEMFWAAMRGLPPSQCSALLDSTGLTAETTVQVEMRARDNTGTWSSWASSGVDTLRPALIESIFPPVRLAAFDQWTLPIEVETSIACECRASETEETFEAMSIVLQSSNGLVHTEFWSVDPGDEFHEIAVRCSSLSGDIDPDLVEAHTGYRQLNDYDPPYPRVALLWGDYDPALGTSFYSRYDLIITWSSGSFTQEIQQMLRSMNPDLKILTTGYISYGGPPMAEWAALTDPADPHFNWVLRDPDGVVIPESYWGHPFYNLTDSSCVEWLVDYNVEQWLETDLRFDGIYFDRIHDDISFFSDQVDADQNGLPDDPAALDSLWANGMKYYLQLIRDDLPHEIMCGNDTPLHFGPYINGRLFEMGLANVMDTGGNWTELVDEYANWENVHREPYNIPIVCSQAPLELVFRYGLQPWNSIPPDSLEWVRTRYQRVRFGLGTTLLSDGVSVYDFGTTWWGNPWWYDEYNIDLGYPTSAPYRLTNSQAVIAFDDFEDGTPGSYNLNDWGAMWSEITNNPGEVINGLYSMKGGNDNMGQTWSEFAHSDLALLPLQADSSYTVEFKYKVLESSSATGYFYFFARSVTGGVPSDVGHVGWTGQTGETDSIVVTFTLESYEDYYLVFGLKYTGEYSVDDIRVNQGGGGMWRKNFGNGAVVVNPHDGQQTVDLGSLLYRFMGQQDPVHNDGQPVSMLTLEAYDAILLLNEPQGEIPPPVVLSITANQMNAVLSWTASPGATGYHIYRDDEAWFQPSAFNRLTLYPILELTFTDQNILGDPASNQFYTVTAVGPTALESEPSNRVGGFDYALPFMAMVRNIFAGVRDSGIREDRANPKSECRDSKQIQVVR